VGFEQDLAIAGSASLAGGLSSLAGSAYGERVHAHDDLATAQRGVADTLLWHLRILAGWLPPEGAGIVRALAARFELENIDARLAALAGDGREPSPFELGGLATAWPRVEEARTTEEVREALGDSAWGEQAGPSAAELAIGLRVSWARRVWETVPEAAVWVAGAGALLVARELFVEGDRTRVAKLRRLPGIDEDAVLAGSLAELRAALPAHAGWPLAQVDDAGELWRAELDWWLRVERDGATMVRSQEARVVVLAAVALLAADAQRTARALAVAGGAVSDAVELVGAGT
jgi:hypothetical protein